MSLSCKLDRHDYIQISSNIDADNVGMGQSLDSPSSNKMHKGT